MPVVSVMMVCNRDTAFLRPAIASVLTQTLADIELLLVDNGAGLSRGTLGDAGRDPRLRLITFLQNRGVSAGRNAALAEARGEFIGLLDHDDIALPTRFEKQAARLRAEPRLGLVSSLADHIDAEGRVQGREFALSDEREQQVFSNFAMPAPASSYTGRREIFARFPFRTGLDLAEDYDFITRAAEICAIGGVPEVLAQYRHHPGQATVEFHAGQILRACVIRLITARRRQGRPENLDPVLEALAPWLVRPPEAKEIYAHFAAACLQEGFPLLAAYHARKLLSVTRKASAIACAGRTWSSALLRSPRDAGTLLRLFFTGPLRTYRLTSGQRG